MGDDDFKRYGRGRQNIVGLRLVAGGSLATPAPRSIAPERRRCWLIVPLVVNFTLWFAAGGALLGVARLLGW